MNRCKTSLVIREMQIKVTARRRDAPGEAAEMKHHDATERRRGRGEAGAPAAAVGAETAPRPLQPAARPGSCAPASGPGNGPRVHAKGVREGL